MAPGSIHLEKRYISQAKVVRLRLPARYVVAKGTREFCRGTPSMDHRHEQSTIDDSRLLIDTVPDHSIRA